MGSERQSQWFVAGLSYRELIGDLSAMASKPKGESVELAEVVGYFRIKEKKTRLPPH